MKAGEGLDERQQNEVGKDSRRLKLGVGCFSPQIITAPYMLRSRVKHNQQLFLRKGRGEGSRKEAIISGAVHVEDKAKLKLCNWAVLYSPSFRQSP